MTAAFDIHSAPPASVPASGVASTSRPLFDVWPRLERDFGFLPLGAFPTPVEHVPELCGPAQVYIKRDDLSCSVYGGNKIRTLEALLGQARREGATRVVASGAYGSNHAVATALSARRAGFRTGALLFPQPYSTAAAENLRVSLGEADEIIDLLHWSLLPLALRWRRARGGEAGPTFVMPPGGAVPRGCLGFVSAGLELGLQIDAGLVPRPDEIIIGLGSTCSTAGLLIGLRVAARLGLGGAPAGSEPPRLRAVRVTPWPLTSAGRILWLARRASSCLFERTRDKIFALPRSELARGLEVDGSQLGAGYGHPSRAGLEAIAALSAVPLTLDTTYSAKSAAALLARSRRGAGTLLYWCTKSSAPLPEVSAERLARAPRRMLAWLGRGRLEQPFVGSSRARPSARV